MPSKKYRWALPQNTSFLLEQRARRLLEAFVAEQVASLFAAHDLNPVRGGCSLGGLGSAGWQYFHYDIKELTAPENEPYIRARATLTFGLNTWVTEYDADNLYLGSRLSMRVGAARSDDELSLFALPRAFTCSDNLLPKVQKDKTLAALRFLLEENLTAKLQSASMRDYLVSYVQACKNPPQLWDGKIAA
jgi:hypothetical protein